MPTPRKTAQASQPAPAARQQSARKSEPAAAAAPSEKPTAATKEPTRPRPRPMTEKLTVGFQALTSAGILFAGFQLADLPGLSAVLPPPPAAESGPADEALAIVLEEAKVMASLRTDESRAIVAQRIAALTPPSPVPADHLPAETDPASPASTPDACLASGATSYLDPKGVERDCTTDEIVIEPCKGTLSYIDKGGVERDCTTDAPVQTPTPVD